MVGRPHAVLLALLALPLPASGRPMRPHFETTDLEMEEPGVVEVDLEVGFVQSRGPYRLVIPDFEIDIGVMPWLEVDLDWTYAIEQPFDHSAGDNVWMAAKLALLDVHDERRSRGWALGLQLGPRFGAAPGAKGIGFEALFVLAHVWRRLHLALDAGGLADPPLDRHHRPLAFEAGLALDIALDARGRLLLNASLNAVYFVSVDPSQLFVTGGVSWSPRPSIVVSATLMAGFLAGDDRVGVLVGYAHKIDLLPGR